MLINCVAYQDGRKLADIDTREISSYLARPGCFVWVALKDATEAELAEMQEEFDLHALAVEDARHAVEAELERLEDQLFSSTSPRASIEALYYVKQKLTTLKHAVAPTLEYAGKLFGGRVPGVCAGLGDYYRDVYDHLVRLNQSIDSERDTVNTAIQGDGAMITSGETQVTKRLAAWAALIAVPTFIASLYGMNFKNMPELEWPFGYPLVLAAMAAFDLYFWYRFRKAGWL